jgi:hypothetical protein
MYLLFKEWLKQNNRSFASQFELPNDTPTSQTMLVIPTSPTPRLRHRRLWAEKGALII